MTISIFDLFKVGIGPSSSHTVGPMKAAGMFLNQLGNIRKPASRISVELYGSLAATGKGHGSDKAISLGLSGYHPESIDPDEISHIVDKVQQEKRIRAGTQSIDFDPSSDIHFLKKRSLPGHPNGMKFIALDSENILLLERTYLSVGGGFVVDGDSEDTIRILPTVPEVEFPFKTSEQLVCLCDQSGLSIASLMLRNESFWRSEAETIDGLLELWRVMQECVVRGCRTRGTMPGKLNVKRRAADLYEKLSSQAEASLVDPLTIMDWVNLYALAVNEENAAGGRVVTAPTNGAAGIIPAVAHYYRKFTNGASDKGIVDFLLTAGAIGILYKENASLSGAEVGCQGEVGVACSMAAGALTAVLGGSPRQVENAAEIGMEHNLGLTCDPVGGLVQIPCIERNAMASMKAINAARLALRGDGSHYVSLDRVIKTMHQTGRDMKTKYKETSRGGLAVNVIEC